MGSGIEWTAERLHRCDPYLVWADASTRYVVSSQPLLPEVAVLIELVSAQDVWNLVRELNFGGPGPKVAMFLPNGNEQVGCSRFVTGLINRPALQELVNLVVRGTVARFTLQDSRPDISAAMQAFQFDTARARIPVRPAGVQPSAGTYLGIVDDGLPFLKVREALAGAQPRACLWDQGWQPADSINRHTPPPAATISNQDWDGPLQTAGTPEETPRGFFYGRRVRSTANRPGNDRNGYALSSYFTPAPRQSHGAGVLGLLAPWTSSARAPVCWPAHIAGLAMVQLPTRTVHDTSGGSLAMRVIDGLRYVLWQEEASRAAGCAPRPVVANVSYGVHAGPHDGTSMFESAIVEMLEQHRHMHVVLPAGNAARAGCHAQRTLAPQGQTGDTKTMTLHVLPDNPSDTFVEIWLPRWGDVELRITPPGSAQAYGIRCGQIRRATSGTAGQQAQEAQQDAVVFGAVYPPQVAQGTEGSMILLAIGATRRLPASQAMRQRGLNQQPRLQVQGLPGLWTLTVENRQASETPVDAWIERDDAPPDRPVGSRQAYFPDSCNEAIRQHNATPEGTLNGIGTATHARLHVVGAMRADGVLSAYSAAGPARMPSPRAGPDVVAPADFSGSVAGLRTAGFVSGTVARLNGTSAACAVYARALASQLATDPTQQPTAPEPGENLPDISCVADSQPQADPSLRGQRQRRRFPFGVEL
jgi:hypothetical protein